MSLLVTLFLQFVPFTSSAAEGSKAFTVKDLDTIAAQLRDNDQSLSSLSSLYHGTVNNIVNAYMDGFTKNNVQNKANTAPPKNSDECKVVGPTMNLSTYCLYLRINGLYSVYVTALNEKQNTVLQDIAAIQQGKNYQDNTANDYRLRQSWINKEINASQSALDAALRAYSEVLIQYPMHLEYQKTLKHLIKYYDHLVDVRKKLATYPTRFQDVTTAKCT